MPLPEFYRLAKGKHDSSQQQQQPSAAASSPSGPGPSSSLHGTGSDFVELVWENGQMIRKGFPTTSVSNPSSHINVTTSCLQEYPHNGRFRDKGAAKGENSEMDFIMNDFQMSGPSELNEHRDDIMSSWLSYHLDDNNEPVRDDYSCNLFTGISGVTSAEPSYHGTSSTPMERGSVNFKDCLSFEQRDLASVRPPNMSQLDRLLSLQNARCLNNTMQNIPCSESDKKRYLSSVHPTKKMQSQDVGQSSSVMNFPHFTALVKPGLHAVSAKANPDVPITKRVNGIGPSEAGFQGSIGFDVSPKQAIVPDEKLPAGNIEKATEPVVVSSVCSGNSVDRASNDPTYGLKRKYTESEDSKFRSEDVEEESIGITKADNNCVGSGSKRSRAAEVHNLSERRRRDRINEKMRALQELIPNCNKVDKASMLDEAIEYLKTLQLQVQMMSMGSGVCMPSMMFPHAAPMPRFTPMGVGYGLAMLDMNMNSSTYPTMHIPQFPMAQASGFGTLNVTQMPNLQMFGFQGQGVAMPTSHVPVVTAPACPPIRTVVDLNTASSAPSIGFISSAKTSPPKDAVHKITLERQISNQEANDELIQAVLQLKDDHPSASKPK